MNKKNLIYYCIECNKEISSKTALYGSKLCNSCSKKQIHNSQYKGGRPHCNTCGKMISYGNTLCKSCSHKNHHNKNCNCMSCQMRRKELTEKNNPNYKNGNCINFSKCFVCWKSTKNYYARICQRCYLNNLKLENNPNWKGGVSSEEYGAEFDNALKEQVRFRDHYKCQVCGCSQLENGRQLDCHHIDYDKRHNDINNLIALCVSCHRKTNGKRKYWKNKLIILSKKKHK